MTNTFSEQTNIHPIEAKVAAMIDNGVSGDELIEHLTETERDHLVEEGLRILIRQVIGEKIAEKVWQSGLGMDATREEVRDIWRSMNIPDADGDECYTAFMEGMSDLRRDDVGDFRTLAKFAPLFEGEADDIDLGEAAENKAARGDKLALSFLAWKEIA